MLEPDVVPLGPARHRLPVTGIPFGVIMPTHARIGYRIHTDVDRNIREHAASGRPNEVGGLVLGCVHTQDDALFVDVNVALAARSTLASPMSVTFTVASWLDLLRRRRRYDDLVVGWYHSHPGHGVFLSTADLFVHEGFFSAEPWYLAIVIDPVSDELGVFAHGGRRVAPCSISEAEREGTTP